MSESAGSSPPQPRFGADFVQWQRARYGHRPPEQRQLTYDIAVLDEYAAWRGWLDAQMDLLEPEQAAELAGKVWLDESFWTVIYELAVGAALRADGYRVAYERAVDGLTPDWTLLDADGAPAGFVEVHTDNPTRETFGQMRAWHGLVRRIKSIPVSIVLMLAPSDQPLAAPDPRTAKKIAQELRSHLLSLYWPSPPAFTSCGYTFLAMGERRLGGRLMDSPFGMAAYFEPPSSRAGIVSADRLLGKVEQKVAKYRNLAQTYQVPLAVAVGAHKFTGVTLGTVDQALQGAPAPSLTLQFGPRRHLPRPAHHVRMEARAALADADGPGRAAVGGPRLPVRRHPTTQPPGDLSNPGWSADRNRIEQSYRSWPLTAPSATSPTIATPSPPPCSPQGSASAECGAEDGSPRRAPADFATKVRPTTTPTISILRIADLWLDLS